MGLRLRTSSALDRPIVAGVCGRAPVSALVLAFGAAVVLAGPATATRPVAACVLPSAGGTSWAFRTGTPITGAEGSYAHGHGGLSGGRGSGRICEVDRVQTAPDRQILLSITQGTVRLQRGITVGGVLGAQLQLPVSVTNSSDSRCRVGTKGTVTLLSSYNGVQKDSVRLSLTSACRSHNHFFQGPSVHVSLP
jgi:hypothetical protein